jgi:Glyoxalase-like domain
MPNASYIKSVTFDCADALVAARFWAAALNSDVEEDSTSARAFVEAPGWGGPNMWFIQVPEPKTAKNRMHLDLRAPEPRKLACTTGSFPRARWQVTWNQQWRGCNVLSPRSPAAPSPGIEILPGY